MNFHQHPNTFVEHVHLKVKTLETSLLFYTEVVGFRVLKRTDNSVSLTADEKTALITIEQIESSLPKQAKTTGLYHFAILLPSRLDLAKIVKHFYEIKFPIGSSDHLVSEALYFSDPDGNGIEIYVDRDPSTWNWNNSMVEMTVDPLDFQDLLSNLEKYQMWEGLPVGAIIGHLHLHVSDIPRTEEFYTKGLGFDVVCRYGKHALFVSTGKYHHHLGLNTWNGVGVPPPSGNSVGLKYYSLILPNAEAREKAIKQLNNLGYFVKEIENDYVTQDPSGNTIHLKVHQ